MSKVKSMESFLCLVFAGIITVQEIIFFETGCAKIPGQGSVCGWPASIISICEAILLVASLVLLMKNIFLSGKINRFESISLRHMDLNKLSEIGIVALFWIIALVEGGDYLRRGTIHLKVGFVKGIPAIVLIGFFFFTAIMFTIWLFRQKKK
jgi:hypothetical protein